MQTLQLNEKSTSDSECSGWGVVFDLKDYVRLTDTGHRYLGSPRARWLTPVRVNSATRGAFLFSLPQQTYHLIIPV
jgi:hypothetical protein